MAPETADLKQKISQQIDAARAKLEALKQDLSSVHEEDMAALQEHQKDIRTRIDQQKERAQQRRSDIARWKSEKVAHTQEAIASWKQRREIEKLEARAERAKDYALDMVSAVVYDFEEAEQAVYDAVAARLEAESAASAATQAG
jgi:regulator of replication initiation timing